MKDLECAKGKEVAFGFSSDICWNVMNPFIPVTTQLCQVIIYYCFFIIVFTQMQKYFLDLKKNMPPLSLIEKNWPARPYIFLDGVHNELQRIFHLWRVSQ